MPYFLDPQLFPAKVRKQVMEAVQRIGKELYERYEVAEQIPDEDEEEDLDIPRELWDKLYAEAEKAALKLIAQYDLSPAVLQPLTWAIHDVAAGET